MDICYTIQKGNIQEFVGGAVFDNIASMVPRGVNVRFKPVHGTPKDSLVDDFRPSRGEFERVINAIVEHQWKDTYLESMLAEGFFTYEDLEAGLPTRTKLQEFAKNEYTCHALQQTLFINANGDVYPCCFLFDDNVGHSPYREKYRMGSLRDQLTKQVPDTDTPEDNPLINIWRGDKLKKLREKFSQ